MREQQYVGIDLHRRRSVIVRMDDAGEVRGVSRIENDPVALSMAVAEAGPATRLRRADVPEAWIAPPEVRELRELELRSAHND